jgi:hypothetical protein
MKNILTKKMSEVEKALSSIPDEVVELLWFKDSESEVYFDIEPSVIDKEMEIEPTDEIDNVEKIHYWPVYLFLDPKQKYLYLNWLKNVDSKIDKGYVYLFYYGLERHLYNGKFEKSFNMVLRLMKTHKISYAYDALFISAVSNNRYDLVEILKQEENLIYASKQHYVDLKHTLKLPFTSQDIINYADNVGFKNKNYIVKTPEEFKKEIEKLLIIMFNKNYIELREINFDNTPVKTSYFSNVSLKIVVYIKPNIIGSSKFIDLIYSILITSHIKIRSKKLKTTKKEEKYLPSELNSEELLFQKELSSKLIDSGLDSYSLSFKRSLKNKSLDFYYKETWFGNIKLTGKNKEIKLYFEKLIESVDESLLEIPNWIKYLKEQITMFGGG